MFVHYLQEECFPYLGHCGNDGSTTTAQDISYQERLRAREVQQKQFMDQRYRLAQGILEEFRSFTSEHYFELALFEVLDLGLSKSVHGRIFVSDSK
jgi:hypothetical protein